MSSSKHRAGKHRTQSFSSCSDRHPAGRVDAIMRRSPDERQAWQCSPLVVRRREGRRSCRRLARSGLALGAALAPLVFPPPLAGEGQGGGEPDGSRNRFENALTVSHDIVIVEAQNTKAFVGKISIPTSVALLLS